MATSAIKQNGNDICHQKQKRINIYLLAITSAKTYKALKSAKQITSAFDTNSITSAKIYIKTIGVNIIWKNIFLYTILVFRNYEC